MVNPPKIRHSKQRRDPVTIDLDAESVKDETSGTAKADAPTGNPLLDEVSPPPPEAETVAPSGDTKPRPDPSADTATANPTLPPRVETRRGDGSAVLAGLVGAVVALAGAGALQYAGVLPAVKNQAGNAEVESLRGEVAALREQIGSIPAPQNLAPRLDELAADLSQTRAQVDALEKGGAADIDTAAVEERFKAIEAAVATARQAETTDLGPVTQRLDALEAAAGEAKQAAAGVASLDQRVAGMETLIKELDGKVAEQAQQPGAALAIAASSLKSAIDRGAPFASELDTYAAVAKPSPEVDELRALAAAGVPSRATIEAAFPEAADAMVAAARPVDPNAGFIDRLMSSAQSVVQVRPVGEVSGDDAGAIVARMEAALKEGNYAAVIGEYEKLPEASKTAGASFIAKVKERQAADRLIDAVLASAIRPDGNTGNP